MTDDDKDARIRELSAELDTVRTLARDMAEALGYIEPWTAWIDERPITAGSNILDAWKLFAKPAITRWQGHENTP